jgi:hypothetical protein
MHLELPKARLNSFKDFAKHYLMIVLSILTALGLEAWIEHAHHAHAAAIASARIEAELGANLAQIRAVRKFDAARQKALTALRDELASELKAKMPEDAIRQRIVAQADDFGFGLQLPELRHEAWDVAVANQSASWIDAGKLNRYATIYAGQQEFERFSAMNTDLNLRGVEINQIATALQLGDIRPRELLGAVNSMISSLHDTGVMLDSLEKAFKKNVPGLAATAALARAR